MFKSLRNNSKQFFTVVFALYLRDVKALYGRKRLGYFWAFAEPLTHILFFVAIRIAGARIEANGIEPVAFIVSGIVPYFLFKNSLIGAMNSVKKNKVLLSFSRIHTMDIILANSLYQLTLNGLIALFAYITLNLLGIEFTADQQMESLYYYLSFWLLGFSIGYFLMPLLCVFDILKFIMKFVMRILYFTSGIIISIELIPTQYREYLLWNPVLYLVENFRESFFSSYTAVQGFESVKYIYIISLFLILFGTVLTKRFKSYIYSDYI